MSDRAPQPQPFGGVVITQNEMIKLLATHPQKKKHPFVSESIRCHVAR